MQHAPKFPPFFLLTAAALGLFAFSGCQGVIRPNAEVKDNFLGYQIKNLDTAPWHDCTLILNRGAGETHEFTHHVGDIAPGDVKRILATEFSKKNGDRFIPVMSKARTLDIQCKMPFLPYSVNLEQN